MPRSPADTVDQGTVSFCPLTGLNQVVACFFQRQALRLREIGGFLTSHGHINAQAQQARQVLQDSKVIQVQSDLWVHLDQQDRLVIPALPEPPDPQAP